LLPSVWERLSCNPLFLDQTETRLEVDRAQVEDFYHPLAVRLLAMQAPAARLLVGVAGPPGSGKTTFATILVQVINAESGAEAAVTVGLDGWHYPNDYLETHFVERDGQRIALPQIKGAPETFDAAAAYDCLSRMRGGGSVSFPVYSRRLHEPLPEAGMVAPSLRIVVVEGNYLLLDEPRWRGFRELFDVRLFIVAREETLLEGLRERHLRGGRLPEDVERWMRRVDRPNIQRVLPGAAHAQVLVHKDDVRHIASVEWSDPWPA